MLPWQLTKISLKLSKKKNIKKNIKKIKWLSHNKINQIF